ncbi:hypothetical protein H5410_032007 [Solanum commersonii]|uniref:Uncharacterized protein n=1 Tax=Solanum commersonii TaxID=4109 RepID=A0A9J5YKW6_SOLCO|nr:hypothetical protein H5410_032007 [Solanum commersonii]
MYGHCASGAFEEITAGGELIHGWPNTFFAQMAACRNGVLCSRLGIEEGGVDFCSQLLTVLGECGAVGLARLKRIIKSRGSVAAMVAGVEMDFAASAREIRERH